MHVEIVSSSSTIYSGEVRQVRVPGTKGSFAVLFNHAPIISSLEKGKIKITEVGGQTLYFEIEGGIIRVKDNVVSIMVEIKEI